jgi:hypothetical protein
VNAAFALDRLDEHGGDVRVHRALDRREIPVGEHREAGRQRAEPILVLSFLGEADDRRRAAVKVPREDEDLGLVLRDPLDRVTPFAGELDRGFDRFGPRVHREHLPVARQLGHLFVQKAQLVAAEGARRQRDAVRLLEHRLTDARVGVTLIDGGVRGEKVEVFGPLDVPDPAAGRLVNDDVQRMVVMGAVLILELDVVRSRQFHGIHASPPEWIGKIAREVLTPSEGDGIIRPP